MKPKNIFVAAIACIAALAASSTGAQEPYRISDLIKDLDDLDPNAELAADVVVRTTDNKISVFPGSGTVLRFASLLVGQTRCGGLGSPVIFVQTGGGYEYRWCDSGSMVAFMDVWVYINGSPYPYGSMDVPCNGGSMPAPVRKIVCS